MLENTAHLCLSQYKCRFTKCVIFSDGPKIHTAVIFEEAQPYKRSQALKGYKLLPDEFILFCVSDSQNACILI